MDINELSLKISKPSEKVLKAEKMNKRKSKLFKTNDENTDISNLTSPTTVSSLKFKEEDYIVSQDCNYALEQFAKLSVGESKENTIINTIRKQLDEPSPTEFMKLSKPRRIHFADSIGKMEPC